MQINKKRLVNEFIKLVKIDSESGEGQEIIRYLKKELEKLNFKTYIDKVGNLIARNSENPKLILSAHTDTVKPGKNIKPIITKSGVIKTDGSTILAADDKSGIAVILEILQILNENKSNIGIEIVFTISEEVGLIGSSQLDFKNLRAKKGINVDCDDPGVIDVGEPSIMQFNISIKGKAAHAGMAPEEGISTIQIASDAISKLKWGRIDKETTANVGVIKGGEARNIIAEEVYIEAEIRSRNQKKFINYYKKLEEQFAKSTKKYHGKIDIKKVQRSTAYVLKNNEVVGLLIKACKKNKQKHKLVLSGGITDANSIVKNGVNVVTFSTGARKIHSTSETIAIKDLAKSAQIVLDSTFVLSEED